MGYQPPRSGAGVFVLGYPRGMDEAQGNAAFDSPLARELQAAMTVGKALPAQVPAVPEIPKGPQRHRGGMARPWVKAIPAAPKVLQKTEGTIMLWEGGAKNTVDIKREIQSLLTLGYTLIEIIDSKRAERPEDPTHWPSLMEVLKWCQSDIAFAQMLDSWNYAHQLELSERVKHDVMNAEEEGADPKLLKVKVDYATKMIPRLVNRGLVEKIEVNQTVHGASGRLQNMPDDALKARAAELASNPKVKRIMAIHMQGENPATFPVEPERPPETIKPGATVIDVEAELDIPEAL